MTWIRWDTSAPRHEIVGALAEALKISPAQAFGHYAAACCGFGEYRPDGLAAAVSDTTLEDWALWRGKAGHFAAVFRQLCLEQRPGHHDLPGTVKGWWRQRAPIDKQIRDAERRREQSAENPRETRAKPARLSRGDPLETRATSWGHDNDNEDVYGTTQSSTASAGARALSDGPDPPGTDPTGPDTLAAGNDLPGPDPPGPTQYAQRCTGAANRGLQENALVRAGAGFNELVTSNQLEAAEQWRTAGIPLDLAAQAIYDRARRYRPSPSYRQPTGLRYFARAVQEAWECTASRHLAGDMVPSAPGAERGSRATSSEADENDFVRAGRELAAELAGRRMTPADLGRCTARRP